MIFLGFPNPGNLLRQGWFLLETNMRIQWDPVYMAFHQICFVETKQIVSSNSNVILKRQRQCLSGSRPAREPLLREANAER